MKFVRKSRLTLSLVMMAVLVIVIISVACSGETEVVEVQLVRAGHDGPLRALHAHDLHLVAVQAHAGAGRRVQSQFPVA